MTNKYRWEPPVQALEQWNPDIVMAADSETSINILGPIGEGMFEEGLTAKLVSGILRKNQGKAITVNINSPGGDFFEGLAIHSILTSHDADVKVNILGLAASAASVIAMAGDEINIAKSGFMMIHNAWTIALGNSADMLEVSEMLKKFDGSMASLYADATGIQLETVTRMMAEETWLSGEDALEQGFASAFLNDDDVAIAKAENRGYNSSLKRVDVSLAKAGMPRSERRALIKELTGMPSAAESDQTPSAGQYEGLGEALSTLLVNLKSISAKGEYHDR